MPLNNPSGKNGYGVKNYPPDDILSQALHQYAKEQLPVVQRLRRLEIEHNLHIKERKLHELNRQFGVPSVKKPPSIPIATALVMAKVDGDLHQRNGTGTIKAQLACEGHMIPRDLIRDILSQYAPEGLASRFPGANRIARSQLRSCGPNHQHHADGHEKLNAQALAMGGVGLNIYGIKDQWSSFIIHLVVVPNNRLADTIGHVYLDAIEKRKVIPVTMTVDKGSEVGYLFAHQTGLREVYDMEYDLGHSPPVVQIKSIHNTPIEGLWHWFLEKTGRNVKDIIVSGHLDGTYHAHNELHKKLFNWLWPQLLQHTLNEFVDYWNNHRIRRQPNKPNMSGSTPRNGYIAPAPPARDVGIRVDQIVIDGLRSDIPTSREESMQWVDGAFAAEAQSAYEGAGSPPMRLANGWEIFGDMLQYL